MRAKFRYVRHTADVAFFAYGRNFKEALQNAGVAMFSLMFDIKKLRKAAGKTKKIIISERAKEKEYLVWYLLQKSLSTVDAEDIQVIDFKVNKLSVQKGKCLGTCILTCKHASEYLSRFDVKAVTPHELEVKEQKNSCRIKVVLDV